MCLAVIICGSKEIVILSGKVADLVRKVLGPPKRYAYSSKPVTMYVQQGEELKRVKGYAVDFEIACDLTPISKAKGEGCLYNPHLVNIVEPGLDGSEINAKVSHSIFLDEAAYGRLFEMSNKSGRLHKYSGVVEGYSVSDIKKAFDIPNLTNTGVCMSDRMLEDGCLRCPETPFDENKHRRYVQASESYRTKLNRHSGKTSISKIYNPEVFRFSVDPDRDYMMSCDF